DILDDMIGRQSFFIATLGAGTGFFNFKNYQAENFITERKLILSPSVGFFHKTGLGISATGYAVSHDKLSFYQASLTPSYDYIRPRLFSTGIGFTKYFTKNNLPFYSTPICNEISGYFSYKRFLVQPAVAIAYGWGSRTEYEEHKTEVFLMRRFRNPRVITVRNEESVRDLSMIFSLRHDFDFREVLYTGDAITITPVIVYSAGTQNFGLNTSFSSTSKRLNNFLPGNQFIKDKTNFDSQSVSAILRVDYSISRFFVQSQFLVDYFLHTADNRLNNAFAVIGGVYF
ncbi:MAG: hypothetical protein JNK79_14505, partial [Chitinophagaceae bacterium]|nr:hypothetical protein [Chitinophagaceae bacterium]